MPEDSLKDEFKSYRYHFGLKSRDLKKQRHAFYFGALKMLQALKCGDGPEWVRDIDEFLNETDRCRCAICEEEHKQGMTFSAVKYLDEWTVEALYELGKALTKEKASGPSN